MVNVNTTLVSLGKLIYHLRKNENLSQTELANLINVSRLTILKIEKGKSVSLETILSILKYFNLLDKFNTLINENMENINLSNFSLYA